MRRYFILVVLFPSVLSATPLVPSLNGNKGLYHVMAGDLGYPGVFHCRLALRAFTSDLGVHYPYRDSAGVISIDSGHAIDTYFGGDFDYAFSLAITRWIELNLRGRYKGDAIDCDDRPPGGSPRMKFPYKWYYNGWENRASIDKGDTDIGVKLVLGKFLRSPVDFALYPYLCIPTGQDRDTSFYRSSFFGRRSQSNRGGVFRYFTNDRLSPGVSFLWSGSTKTESPTSGYLNFGYQLKGAASELQYGLGADVLFFDYFDPFIEFWGSKRSILGDDPFGDRPPAYITLGAKFIGTGISADLCVDFLVLGKRKYDFEDFIPEDTAKAQANNVVTGWGMRPTWAVNLGVGYSHDLYRMAPISNKGMIMGRTIDVVTKTGVDAILSVTGTPRLLSDPLTGAYETKVSPGKVRVVVAKKGYKSETKLAMISRGERVVMDFELEPEVQHAVVTGKAIDKWTTKQIDNVEMILSRRREKLPGATAIEPGTLTKTIGGKSYKLNPETGTWELVVESLTEEDITTELNGELHRLNLVTGKWEKVKGAPTPVTEEEITMIIDGELHRLNLVTGTWEKVKGTVRLKDVVKEEDITQTIDGELYKLNLVTGAWEKVKVPTTQLETLADTVATTNAEGLYRLDLVPPGTHLVSTKKEGYIPQISPVVCKPSETSVLNFELYAEKIILRGVHFEFDKANLLVDSYLILEKVYGFLKDNPDIRVEIGGHTCSIASDEYNLELSDQRANAVRNYLLMHGVEPDRITAKGYGESMPMANNSTEEGRMLNRRIELKMLK